MLMTKSNENVWMVGQDRGELAYSASPVRPAQVICADIWFKDLRDHIVLYSRPSDKPGWGG